MTAPAAAPEKQPTTPEARSMLRSVASRGWGRWPAWLTLLVVMIVVASTTSEYIAYVGAVVALAAILAASLNVALGLVGLLSFAQLSFYAIGAYGTIVLIGRFDLPFVAAAAISIAAAAVLAIVFGLVAIRYTKGLFFALTTFALSEVLRLVATIWYDVTGGPSGLVVGWSPSIFGLEWSSSQGYLIAFSVILVGVLAGTSAVLRRPLGQRLLALREDPYLAEGMGIRVLRHQIGVFAVSAAVAALAGCFAGPFYAVITPSIMGVAALIPLVGMVVVGGKGTVLGPVVGAAIFTLPPILFSSLGTYNGMILGVAVVLVAMFIPNGILSHWRPELRLTPSSLISRRTS